MVAVFYDYRYIMCACIALDGSDDDKLFCFRENPRGIELLHSARPAPESPSSDDGASGVADDQLGLEMSVYDEGAAADGPREEDEENEMYIDDDSDESDDGGGDIEDDNDA